ncbi:hypothetical protein, partial [Burkholderia ubonensis]|uniref:hypothetical protein n=1 Tax=Burkholderia ubonensis TaxID=101571 RepID=UPI001C4A0A62
RQQRSNLAWQFSYTGCTLKFAAAYTALQVQTSTPSRWKKAQPSFTVMRAFGNTWLCPFAAAEITLRSRHIAQYSPLGSASFFIRVIS